MKSRGDLMTHLRLVSRMAKCTDADVVKAFEAGNLAQEDWAGMVQTCRTCRWAGRCAEWLDGHDHAADAPKQCLNRQILKRLQTEEDEPAHV